MLVDVLFSGYSKFQDGKYLSNCSCVLIKGPPNVIVDTMTAWDEQKILQALEQRSIKPDDIDFVVCTHGHSDHIGCNHLFKKAIHIVGYSISHKDTYFTDHDFRYGQEYSISEEIKVIPTPGHTSQDVSVLVTHPLEGIIAITGDLFEKFEDLNDASIWKSAGSDDETLQELNREKILKIADIIIPGHGEKFMVPKED